MEKLNATQQLTAMIILASTVNVMSNKEDCCFQCQEPGHIAWHFTHINCYECDEYGYIIMDCPHRIPPSKTPVTHHMAHKGHQARLSLRHHHKDQDRQSQSRSQFHYWRHCSLSYHNWHRGYSTSQHQDRCNHHRSSSWWSHSSHRGHNHRHTGIYIMAIGLLIPVGLGIFCCYFFWCWPASLAHWPLQSGSMWYTIVDDNVEAAPMYRFNSKAGRPIVRPCKIHALHMEWEHTWMESGLKQQIQSKSVPAFRSMDTTNIQGMQ